MSGARQCLLYEVEGCPLLGGSKCISSMVKSFGGKSSVCCREIVRFSDQTVPSHERVGSGDEAS